MYWEILCYIAPIGSYVFPLKSGKNPTNQPTKAKPKPNKKIKPSGYLEPTGVLWHSISYISSKKQQKARKLIGKLVKRLCTVTVYTVHYINEFCELYFTFCTLPISGYPVVKKHEHIGESPAKNH